MNNYAVINAIKQKQQEKIKHSLAPARILLFFEQNSCLSTGLFSGPGSVFLSRKATMTLPHPV